MLTRMVVALSLLTLALPLCAQTALPAGAVTGEVIANDVYVRSAPSTTGAYPCTKVSRGTKLVVIESKGDWLKIAPVEGCYSVISKKYVAPDTTGKAGTVVGSNVWLRAGGTLCAWNEVTSFSFLQRRMNEGEKLQILGEAGDYYKVTPVEGSYYWIFSKYVNLGGQKPTVTVGDGSVQVKSTPATPTTAGSVEVTAEPPADTGTGVESALAKLTTSAPATGGVSPRIQFMAAEKDMQTEYKKPADQRDLKAILAKYTAIKPGNDDYLKRAIDSRVSYLKSQISQYAEARELQDSMRKWKEDQAKLRSEISKVTIKMETQKPVTVYAADGVLTASGLFPGTSATPKRWVTRDPDTNRITAYVQCTTGEVDLNPYVGKHVGITGATRYDKDLGLYIVEAKEIRVLKDDAKLPEPPQPVVGKLPAPAVEAEPAPVVTPAPAEEKAPVTAPKAGEFPEEVPAPTTKPAATVPAAPAATEPANEQEAADKAAAEQDNKPDMGPITPDSLPAPTSKPADTAPASQPVVDSTPLPATGLEVSK